MKVDELRAHSYAYKYADVKFRELLVHEKRVFVEPMIFISESDQIRCVRNTANVALNRLEIEVDF